MVMPSSSPVPGPVSASTAGTDLGGTFGGISGGPASREVQLLPLASSLGDSALDSHRVGAAQGSGSAVFVTREACGSF